MVNITDNVCTKQGNSLKKICGLLSRAVSNQDRQYFLPFPKYANILAPSIGLMSKFQSLREPMLSTK